MKRRESGLWSAPGPRHWESPYDRTHQGRSAADSKEDETARPESSPEVRSCRESHIHVVACNQSDHRRVRGNGPADGGMLARAARPRQLPTGTCARWPAASTSRVRPPGTARSTSLLTHAPAQHRHSSLPLGNVQKRACRFSNCTRSGASPLPTCGTASNSKQYAR